MRTPIPKQATIRKHIETTNSILRPKSNCETDNTSISETSDNPEVNADHEESCSNFKNSGPNHTMKLITLVSVKHLTTKK